MSYPDQTKAKKTSKIKPKQKKVLLDGVFEL